MTDRRSIFRRDAERIIRRTVNAADRKGMSVRALRKALRAAYVALRASTSIEGRALGRGVWYAAIRDATGRGVLALTDPRQQRLPLRLDPAPRLRTRRSRRKKTDATA